MTPPLPSTMKKRSSITKGTAISGNLLSAIHSNHVSISSPEPKGSAAATRLTPHLQVYEVILGNWTFA